MPLGTARSTSSTARVFPKALTRPEAATASADCEPTAASQDAVLCTLIAASLGVGLLRLDPRSQRAVSMPPRRRASSVQGLAIPELLVRWGSTLAPCGSNL